MAQENRVYPLLAYSPLPAGFIKEELVEPSYEDEEESNQHRDQLQAYPPVPHSVIKEEFQSENGHDVVNPEIQVYKYQQWHFIVTYFYPILVKILII